jgi:hypothetical protein
MAVVLSPFLWANDPDHNANNQKNWEEHFDPVDENGHQYKHRQTSSSQSIPDRWSSAHWKAQPKCSEDDSDAKTGRRPGRILIATPKTEGGQEPTRQSDDSNSATAIN